MSRAMKGLFLLAVAFGAVACTGGSAYVGVYGPPVYGPGPWGPRAGPYGPYGGYPPGGVWVGVPVCCDEEQQQEEQQPEEESPEEESPEAQGELSEVEGGSDEAPDGTVEPSTSSPDDESTPSFPTR